MMISMVGGRFKQILDEHKNELVSARILKDFLTHFKHVPCVTLE